MKTHKWVDLKSKMSPEAQAEVAVRVEQSLAAMDLQDLLRERGFTQEELARELEIQQGNVSRMLRRTNMHVSTLQDVVEAMGGELEITARFPDADYRIDQFTSNDRSHESVRD